MSDFEVKYLKRVRLQIKIFETCEILKQKCYNVSDFEKKILERVEFCEKMIFFKVSPNSSLYLFHNVFLHKAMYNYSLHYLRQLGNSILHPSNKNSCLLIRKDFEF